MKHKKQYADKLIGYDPEAPTAWITLLALVAITIVFVGETFVDYKLDVIEYELSAQEARAATLEKEAEAAREEARKAYEAELEAQRKEQRRQGILAELRNCESDGYDHAIGDGGDSVGPYQWQKPTLEHKLGRSLTYDEYYAIATDYDTIHELTYKTYFEDGETWRWKRCTKIIGYAG